MDWTDLIPEQINSDIIHITVPILHQSAAMVSGQFMKTGRANYGWEPEMHLSKKVGNEGGLNRLNKKTGGFIIYKHDDKIQGRLQIIWFGQYLRIVAATYGLALRGWITYDEPAGRFV
jgi:hypothetical protein